MNWTKTSDQLPSPATRVVGLYVQGQNRYEINICGFGSKTKEGEVVFDLNPANEHRWWIESLTMTGSGFRAPDYWMNMSELPEGIL
jgi:hypothetical protein